MPPHTRSMSGQLVSTPVRERAIIVRDILSSFQEDWLPSEYMPEVYQEIINRTNIGNDPHSHVKQTDLEGSLFRLGSYYEQAHLGLLIMRPNESLSRIYRDKLSRRFAGLFEEYDSLNPTADNPNPRGAVTKIIEQLQAYDKGATRDREERRRRESPDDSTLTRNIDRGLASMLVTQLRALCQRSRYPNTATHHTDEPAPKKPKTSSSSKGQKSPRTPLPAQKTYLFTQILGKASMETGFFALDVLEQCSPESLEGLQSDQDREPGLRGLLLLLESEGASEEYQTRFAALVTSLDDDE